MGEPGCPGIPHHGRSGQETGAHPILIRRQIGGDDVVEKPLERSGQGADDTSKQDRGVSRLPMLPDTPNRFGRGSVQYERRQTFIDEVLQLIQPCTLIAAIDLPQEDATIFAFGAQVVGKLSDNPHQFPRTLRQGKLRQLQPQVGFDDIGGHHGAI